MKPKQNIEKIIKKFDININADKDRQILNELRQAQTTSKVSEPGIFIIVALKMITKSKITGFAAASITIIAFLFGANILTSTPTWAIEDTAQALQNIRSVTASGELAPESEDAYDFKLYFKASPNNPYSFWVRAESDENIGVVRDNILYNYISGSSEIYSYDIEKDTGIGFPTQLWYEIMKRAPLIIPTAPTMLQAIKNMAGNWEEEYEKDEITKRKCVFVSGTFEPLSVSFLIVFDLETKLIVRATYWTNPDRQGTPALNITDIVYNTQIEDEMFYLEKTTGAEIINPEESQLRGYLWNYALKLGRNNQDAEALEAYLQLYEKYPQYIKTPEALCIIARYYHDMDQYDKAIEYLEKVPRKYSFPEYAIIDAYKLLGLYNKDLGRDTEALDNFEKCLMLLNQSKIEGPNAQKSKEYLEDQIEEIKSREQR